MDILKGRKLILASASPRRKELLEKLDLPFVVRPVDTDEFYPESLPAKDVAGFLARHKAQTVRQRLREGEIMITADTVVVLGNQILGKPENHAHAVAILNHLSGKQHRVYTGICLTSTEKQICFTEVSTVHFRHMEGEEIEYYINRYKPFDKAGGYGIQEWIGDVAIDRIEGSYNNIVGLPSHKLYEALKAF